MVNENDAQWYLHLPEGKKGPFRTADLDQFFRSGRIKATDTVSSSLNEGTLLLVEQVLAPAAPPVGMPIAPPSAPPPAAPTPKPFTPSPSGSSGFQPPPRPDPERTSTKLVMPTTTSKPDATLSLFDSLQAAKERKPREPMAVPDISPSPPSAPWGLDRNKILLGVGLVIAITLSAWSAYEYFGKSISSSSKDKSTATSSPTGKTGSKDSYTPTAPNPPTARSVPTLPGSGGANPFGSRFSPPSSRGGTTSVRENTPPPTQPPSHPNERAPDRDPRRDEMDREADHDFFNRRDAQRQEVQPRDNRDENFDTSNAQPDSNPVQFQATPQNNMPPAEGTDSQNPQSDSPGQFSPTQ